MATTTITKPELFLAAAHCVSAEQSRPQIGGVLIEPLDAGGAVIVATDGHIAFCGYDAAATVAESVTIALPFRKPTAAWWEAAGFSDMLISKDTASLVSRDTGALCQTTPVRHVSQGFPDWRRVLPNTYEANGTSTAFYDASQLATLHAIALRLADGRKSTPHVVPNGLDPARVHFGDRDDCLAVVMPMRFPERGTYLPDWARAQ